MCISHEDGDSERTASLLLGCTHVQACCAASNAAHNDLLANSWVCGHRSRGKDLSTSRSTVVAAAGHRR